MTKKISHEEIDGIFKYVVEVRCDRAADIMPPDPEWYLGSIAVVAEARCAFMLDSSGEWVKLDCVTLI